MIENLFLVSFGGNFYQEEVRALHFVKLPDGGDFKEDAIASSLIKAKKMELTIRQLH